MKYLSYSLLALTVFLFTGVNTFAQEPQLSYWAPGTINRAEGCIEMDVEFLDPRPALISGWSFLFQATGNDFSAGTTILGVVLCPPMDGRDFVAIARGGNGSVNLDSPAPDFELKRPYRVAISWGKGQFSFWFDGRLLGRDAFNGQIALLPEKFRAGFDSEKGLPSSYRIQKIRISDSPRSGQTLQEVGPLISDGHATLVLGEDGVATSGKPTAWQTDDFRSAIFPVRAGKPLATAVGKAFTQSLCLVNFAGTASSFDLNIEIKNRAGAPVASKAQTVRVPANTHYQPLNITLPVISKSGYYEATMRVRDPAGREETYDLAFVVQSAEELSPGKLSGFLGHHLLPFSKLGYGWMRSWAHDRVFLWSNVEPAQGEFRWAAADHYVENAEKEGLKILGVLGYPPRWASTYSPEERDRLKISRKGTFSNCPDRYQPRDLEEWKTYVRNVVSRYRGRVKFWEIYNEVDFHPPAMHASFSGSTDDYLQLLKSAHEIIKEVDPSAQVLTSGFSLTKGTTDVKMPADLIAAGGAAYFDIFNVHGYTSKSVLEENIKLVRAAKPNVPVWQSEHMFLDGPNDDYQIATKCFWTLSQGFDKFFLHGGEFHRDFGDLYPTPYFAVTAELGRQLRACDEFLGPVEGEANGVLSWKLRRSDGSFLHVFAVDNGRARLTFESTGAEPDILATDLYGETIFQGKLEAGTPLDLAKLSYVASPTELKIAGCERKLTNVIANPGFEMRDGDYAMDESLARPVFWTLRPEDSSPSLMTFAPGRAGKYAIRLQTPPVVNRLQVGQVVMLASKGKWRLSASMKAAAGTKMFILLKTNQNGQWIEVASQEVAATGAWQKVSVPAEIPSRDTQGVVLVGLASENSGVEIDDVELMHEKSVP